MLGLRGSPDPATCKACHCDRRHQPRLVTGPPAGPRRDGGPNLSNTVDTFTHHLLFETQGAHLARIIVRPILEFSVFQCCELPSRQNVTSSTGCNIKKCAMPRQPRETKQRIYYHLRCTTSYQMGSCKLCTRLTKALALAPEFLRFEGSRQFGIDTCMANGKNIRGNTTARRSQPSLPVSQALAPCAKTTRSGSGDKTLSSLQSLR